MKTPAESQSSFCSIDKDEDSMALANKASCLLTELYNLVRFAPLAGLVLFNMVRHLRTCRGRILLLDNE